jgi:uncharacterized protein
MQRPVMNPSFSLESPSTGKARKPRFAWMWRILGFLVKLLMATPFGKRKQFRNEEGTRLSRFVRALTYRLAFVPVVLVAFLTALVFGATHPGRNAAASDPLKIGVYYDPVNFVTEDGVRLEGWLIPVINAKRVLTEGESILNKQYPAVVLVHDFAGSRDQLMPMVEPLHKSGIVVLAINLRGAASASTEAQTFGIREALDIKAAVEMLRRRPYVDPTRVALIGLGTGANAAIIAAGHDESIRTLVLSAPVNGFDEALANRIGPERRWLPAMRPLLRWTFQVMYGLEAGELDLKNHAKMLASREVHMTDNRAGVFDKGALTGIQDFLRVHLAEPKTATTSAR